MNENSNPWYRYPHLRKLNFCILSLTLFSSANGFDGSLMNGLIALPQWKEAMDYPAGTWLGFINAIYALGCVLSYPISSWICNKYGRKPGVWAGYVLLFAGAAIQTAANSDTPFVVARLLLGFASGFFLACPLLLAESAYPTHQTTASSLYMCGWYVGAVTSAWATFATRNIQSSWAWRIPSALQIAMSLLALPGFLLIDESPRWLISMDRNDEARRILAKIHAAGDYDSELVMRELTEIETALQAELKAQSSTWFDLFKTPGNRRRLLITMSLAIFSQWSGGGTVSYYLTGVLVSNICYLPLAIDTNKNLDNSWHHICHASNLNFCMFAGMEPDLGHRSSLFGQQAWAASVVPCLGEHFLDIRACHCCVTFLLTFTSLRV